MTAPAQHIDALLAEIRACTACAAHLPLGPRPVLHVSATARILIASQAPGTAVHHAGISFWDNSSGDRLRAWLGLGKDAVLRRQHVSPSCRWACVTRGACRMAATPPPRPECAPLWRARVLAAMPALRLVLLVGSYAQAAAAAQHGWKRAAMTERVADFRRYLPRYFPLPHPSWRTGVWQSRHPWFETDVLPALRAAVAEALERPIAAPDTPRPSWPPPAP